MYKNVPVHQQVKESGEIDYSMPIEDDFGALNRDIIPVRSMREDDLSAVVRIDTRVTGRNRQSYYERKMQESLHESGIRVSLIAEVDGQIVGFVMARVDFGEFGQAEPEAVLDTIGVDPDEEGRGVGASLISNLIANLGTLRVEHIRTLVASNDTPLLSFFTRCGFHPSQRIAFVYRLDAA